MPGPILAIASDACGTPNGVRSATSLAEQLFPDRGEALSTA